MKRDMDLARSILLEVEKYPEPDGWADIKIEGFLKEVKKAAKKIK
jgi:hypothetical protein